MSTAIEIYQSSAAIAPVIVPVGDGDVADGVPYFRLWRCSVEKYHEMTEAGIFGPEDRLELLEGWIVEKATESARHSLATDLVREELRVRAGEGFRVTGQHPVTLAASEPEPDAVLVRGTLRDYARRHPGPSDVVLVVEISDSSLAGDRGSKREIYARNGLLPYWIVNLVHRQVEVYNRLVETAAGRDYAPCEVYKEGQSVPLVVEGQTLAEIPVAAILP